LSSFPELPDYEILRELGAGGQSQVFLALDSSLKVEVVVKTVLLQQSIDPTATARFLNEARRTARLKHPNIVEVKRLFDHGGRVYLVMEHVAGMDLSGIIARARALPPIFVLAVLDQVAAGLEAAHAAGFIHRDIKPANILMSGDGDVKVTDFGLVRSLAADAADTLTEPSHVVGTPAYMSPQQAQGAVLDERTDMFSLGVLAFEAFSGRRPFDDPNGSGDHQKVLQNIVRAPTPELAFSGWPPPPEAGKRIRETVARMLEKDPERRFQSMGDLRRELRTCLRETDAGGVLDELGRRRVFGRFATDPEKSAREFQQQVESVTRTVAAGARAHAGPGRRSLPVVAGALVLAAAVGAWLVFGRGDDPSLAEAPVAAVTPSDAGPIDDATPRGAADEEPPEDSPAKAVPPPPRAPAGELVVGTEPAGALVEARLAGAPEWSILGPAPLTERLAPGSWELRFSKDCHRAELRTAGLADGETVSVEATLRPLDSAFVRLTVTPYVEGETRYAGDVFLDGRSRGDGGNGLVLPVPSCGSHEVEVRMPRIFGTYRRTIAEGSVAPADTLDLGAVAFRTGALRIRSVPSSTFEVRIDGRPDPRRAYLPYVREVAEGKHVIALTLPPGRSVAGAEVQYGDSGPPVSLVPDSGGRLEVPVEVRTGRECAVVFNLSG
jgi:serine/threonine-protein kinase